VDRQTHISANPTYQSLFINIFKLIEGRLGAIDEIDFYQMFPDFKVNQAVASGLKFFFIYRTLVLTLQYLGASASANKMLSQVSRGLNNYI